jgi:hypothetical protein
LLVVFLLVIFFLAMFFVVFLALAAFGGAPPSSRATVRRGAINR